MTAITQWTLISVTYNSSEALRRFWADSPLPASVRWIVVDNASTDDSITVARAAGAEVIALPHNIGFGAANNHGFQHVVSPYVGFVNPDVRVDFASLTDLASVIDRTGGIVAPQLLNADGTVQPNGRGRPYLAHKILNRLSRSGRESEYRLYADDDSEREVAWLMGAVVLGARETFASLGPWDPHFFVYYEDSDLGLRAAAQGVPSLITGRSRWVHGWARETKKLAWGPWKREVPSMLKFYARYPCLLSPVPSLTEKRIQRDAMRAHLIFESGSNV